MNPTQNFLLFFLSLVPFSRHSHTILRKALKQKDQENKLHQEELSSLKASQDKINDLETQAANAEKELADWDAKIQHWNEEIKIIQIKLANAEYQKGLVRERMGNPASKIEAEAVEAIKHFDNAIKLPLLSLIRS